jgi:hypothetical protein
MIERKVIEGRKQKEFNEAKKWWTKIFGNRKYRLTEKVFHIFKKKMEE